jgi:hypothetical protein
MNKVLATYKEWLASATQEQIDFADQVYSLAVEHYEAGGDRIVECWEPKDVLEFFKNIQEVQEFFGLVVEQRRNARWGEDSDPELLNPERQEI